MEGQGWREGTRPLQIFRCETHPKRKTVAIPRVDLVVEDTEKDTEEVFFRAGEVLRILDVEAPEGFLMAKNSDGVQALVPDVPELRKRDRVPTWAKAAK